MALADRYDGFLFDLDGVVYLGGQVVEQAPSTFARLRERGCGIGFVTNNAGRSPQRMAEQISAMGIDCEPDQVATSAQAIVGKLREALPPSAAVLVVGSDFLADEVRRSGLTVVESADDQPAAVVQGWASTLGQAILMEGCLALERGALWYVSNTDLTIPTDRGLGPGSGSYVRLVAGVTKREPDCIAGKPHEPLLRAGLERLGAKRPLFVGDRLDTDIQGGKALGMATLWVTTGAHGKHDLVTAPPEQRPQYIARDVSGLLDEPYEAVVDKEAVRCRDARASVDDGRVRLDQGDDPVAALWAVATLAWDHPEARADEALDRIDLP